MFFLGNVVPGSYWREKEITYGQVEHPGLGRFGERRVLRTLFEEGVELLRGSSIVRNWFATERERIGRFLGCRRLKGRGGYTSSNSSLSGFAFRLRLSLTAFSNAGVLGVNVMTAAVTWLSIVPEVVEAESFRMVE